MTQQEFFKRYTYSPSLDRIGGGGFGTVYKAKDNVLHREVAIKVSEVKTAADGKKTFSLKDEFEALAHVPKHPNIANYEEFYSFEMPNGIFDYAVMQYYPDGNLSNAIKQCLTAEQKEDIATQLLEGIDFLHKHKVVHRDLKPGNILIVKDGSKVIPLITDFGLSKAAGVVDGSVFSNSFGAGTPRYSSPEQLQGNPLRFNTDLWSYGAILYELFTGEQLFTAGSGAANTAQADVEIYNKIVNGNVQSLGKMPEKWRKVAERCLVVDPTKRAKDAAELFAIIKGDEDETIGSSSGSGITKGPKMPANTPPIDKPSPKAPHSGLDPLSPTPNDKPKSKKGLWIGLGIAAAVILALLLLLKPKQESTPSDPDTQAYEACKTVADYRAYISEFGSSALHYANAQTFINLYVADSIQHVQDSLTVVQARQLEKREQNASDEIDNLTEEEKQEEAASKACTTLTACDNFLKKYPESRFAEEVLIKKTVFEAETKQISLTDKVNGHGYVDLGLPSGTMWATCNVGASKPEGRGNYYAWGETKTKKSYNWKNYKFSRGSRDKLTKYCNNSYYGFNGYTDDLTTLQVGDDPATVNWGNVWSTPTMTQWFELLENTSNYWIKRNGIYGRVFVANNGHWLFLPCAGVRVERRLDDAGEDCYYMSSSLDENYPDAVWVFNQALYEDIHNKVRCLGYSVRPVYKK